MTVPMEISEKSVAFDSVIHVDSFAGAVPNIEIEHVVS
jgi:hypothetical protein